MAVETVAVAAVAALAAYYIASTNEGLADNILLGRKVLFGAAGAVGAIILIGTGVTTLVLFGAAILFIIWLWVFREEPYDELR